MAKVYIPAHSAVLWTRLFRTDTDDPSEISALSFIFWMICSARRQLHLQVTIGIIIIGIRTVANNHPPQCLHLLQEQQHLQMVPHRRLVVTMPPRQDIPPVCKRYRHQIFYPYHRVFYSSWKISISSCGWFYKNKDDNLTSTLTLSLILASTSIATSTLILILCNICNAEELSKENEATKGKMRRLRLVMEQRRAKRKARRQARAAPYTTQWAAMTPTDPNHESNTSTASTSNTSTNSAEPQNEPELQPCSPEPVVAWILHSQSTLDAAVFSVIYLE